MSSIILIGALEATGTCLWGVHDAEARLPIAGYFRMSRAGVRRSARS